MYSRAARAPAPPGRASIRLLSAGREAAAGQQSSNAQIFRLLYRSLTALSRFRERSCFPSTQSDAVCSVGVVRAEWLECVRADARPPPHSMPCDEVFVLRIT